MDFKTQLENIATAKSWAFVYARRDFQNLFDASNFVVDAVEGFGVDETVMFVDPIKRATTPEGVNYTGAFMIVTRANHDKPYEERYTLFIEPLLAEIKSIYNGLKCANDVITWNTTEVINIFDLNADGLLINYQVNGID